MTPEEIVAKFAYSLDQFEPISGQPSDSDLTIIWEVVAPLLLQIPYDETGAVHNLIGLIRTEAAYIVRYGTAFPEPVRVRAYDPSIEYDAMAVVSAHIEAAHKAKRTDRATYKTERQETEQFILAVVSDIWVQELRDTNKLYNEVAPKDLLSHLQGGCTGRHSLDLLALHNKIQRYHHEVEVIPKYINMLKDAQKQAGRAGQAISNETLLLFATTAMLTTKKFLRTNNDWEDRAESDKTWENWKGAYNKAHAKARIKAQANEGTVKFGAANSAAQLQTTQILKKTKASTTGGLRPWKDTLNLAVTAVNKKLVLEKLVDNNTKLADTNKNLVAMVKTLNDNISDLEQETSCLKKGGQSKQDPTLCHHLKKEGYHAPESCYELVKNKG